MIDTLYHLETPEGISLHISPAGPIARSLAFGIDWAIRLLTIAVIAVPIRLIGDAGIGILMISFFLLEWFYPVAFEVLGGGQTPGKRAFGLRVVNLDGTPIGWNASLVRNLLRFADFLPALYAVGLVSVLCTENFQRLGDLAAGTLVITLDQPGRASPGQTIEGAKVSSIPLFADDERAVLAFAERSGELSEERMIELAAILEPVTAGRGAEGARELLQIANGLAGRR